MTRGTPPSCSTSATAIPCSATHGTCSAVAKTPRTRPRRRSSRSTGHWRVARPCWSRVHGSCASRATNAWAACARRPGGLQCARWTTASTRRRREGSSDRPSSEMRCAPRSRPSAVCRCRSARPSSCASGSASRPGEAALALGMTAGDVDGLAARARRRLVIAVGGLEPAIGCAGTRAALEGGSLDRAAKVHLASLSRLPRRTARAEAARRCRAAGDCPAAFRGHSGVRLGRRDPGGADGEGGDRARACQDRGDRRRCRRDGRRSRAGDRATSIPAGHTADMRSLRRRPPGARAMPSSYSARARHHRARRTWWQRPLG